MNENILKKIETLIALVESEKNVSLCEIKNQARVERLTATTVAGIRNAVEDYEILTQLKSDLVDLKYRYFISDGATA